MKKNRFWQRSKKNSFTSSMQCSPRLRRFLTYFTRQASDLVLIAFAILGLVFTFKNNRRIFWTFAAFIYSYSIIFYLVFRFEPRFFMGLLPFYAILAGYGFYEIQKMLPSPVPQKIFLLVLLIPLAFVLRLDWLAIQNDSRT